MTDPVLILLESLEKFAVALQTDSKMSKALNEALMLLFVASGGEVH